MEAHPAVSVSNYDIWEHILSFLKPTEEFMPAMVCRDFYQILRTKRVKRGAKVWITDITVFCKTVEWTKFVILTTRHNLEGQWASRLEDKYKGRGISKIYNLYVLIKNIALGNGYYDTYKFIDNIIHYEKEPSLPDYTLKLTENNYGFLRNMLDDLVPVNSPYFTCKVIETLNLPLIKTLLTNNPAINRDKYLHYLYLPQSMRANTVLNYTYLIIYKHQHEISNARDILNFVADMYGKYSKLTGPFEYTLDEYILSKVKLTDIIFLHEIIGVPGCPGIAILALKYYRLDILEYTLEKQFPLCKSVADTIIKTMPDLAKKYQIFTGTD